MIELMRKLVAGLALAGYASCSSGGGTPPPQPPQPPSPICEEGATCGCWHQPPGQGWQQLPPCPTPPPPPSGACVPILSSAMLPPLDNETDWKPVPDPIPNRQAEVNAAILAAQAACPSGWTEQSLGACLTSGVAGIDNGFAQIAAQLHAKGIRAGQPYVQNDPGKRIDALAVEGEPNVWQSFHLLAYTNGCLTQSSYKGTWRYTGTNPNPLPPTPAPIPPVGDACPVAPCPLRLWTAETLPPGWDPAQIGKPAYEIKARLHTMGNGDSTPVVVRQEPFCAAIGLSPYADGQPRASCPVRPDGHPDRVVIENWLLFGGPVRDSRSGQDCTPHSTDNPAAFLWGTGNCRICNTPKTACSDWY